MEHKIKQFHLLTKQTITLGFLCYYPHNLYYHYHRHQHHFHFKSIIAPTSKAWTAQNYKQS